MYKNAFSNLYWGFFFTMLDFRIGHFDILPDIIGYILFFIGLSTLAYTNDYFRKAKTLSIPMIILSIPAIYENQISFNSVNFGTMLGFNLIIGIASLIIGILIVYDILQGVRELATHNGVREIAFEAEDRWVQFIWLQVAGVGTFLIIFIPFINLIYAIALLIAAIILTVNILKLMKKCGEQLESISL